MIKIINTIPYPTTIKKLQIIWMKVLEPKKTMAEGRGD